MNSKGSVIQSERSASTTSRCRMKRTGLRFPVPRKRATRFLLLLLGLAILMSSSAKHPSGRRLAIASAGVVTLTTAAVTLNARSKPVQKWFGRPKAVLHVVVYKFKDNVSNYDREKAISGIKDMAGKIPGIKNVWLKTSRNQIKDFSGVYAIEFTSAEAAADYAESPVHEAWSKMWQEQRENSLSFQISNP